MALKARIAAAEILAELRARNSLRLTQVFTRFSTELSESGFSLRLVVRAIKKLL
jgi:hypothetical protein